MCEGKRNLTHRKPVVNKPRYPHCQGLVMRIAQIAPLVESVPPTLYGGTERVVSWLTEELVALGHDVTLFASGDSVTKATLEPVVPRSLRLTGIHDSTLHNRIMLDRVAARQDEFDVLHFHIDFFQYP